MIRTLITFPVSWYVLLNDTLLADKRTGKCTPRGNLSSQIRMRHLAMFGNKDMIKIHPYTFTNHTQLEKVIEN
jgi:hypothetical protein